MSLSLRSAVVGFVLILSNLTFIQPANASLYAFTSHTFTNCSKTGVDGPTLGNCQTAYSATSWELDASLFTTSAGIQIWTVPITGTYTIQASGASGSFGNAGSGTGGLGARVKGDFNLNRGDKIRILVGQMGFHPGTTVSGDGAAGGGGGGSFVVSGTTGTLDAQVLVVAAGGGGANDRIYQNSTVNGLNGLGTTTGTGDEIFNGGSYRGSGSAGFINGMSFANGGRGGTYTRGQTATGGFGGGGTNDDSASGGGGWVGGNNASVAAYSKNNGANALNENGINSGHGSVTFTLIAQDTTAPTFTSSTSFSVSENIATSANAATIKVSESATVTISSGADAALFNIITSDTATAFIRFKTSPNFEAPSDSGGNNVYDLVLTATDLASNAGTQTITITVTDVVDTSAFNSFALSGSVSFRTVVTITANVTVASRVTFRARNVIIPGCKNKLTSGSSPNIVASCTWRPSTRGAVVLTATASPTGAGISSTTATPISVMVGNRSGGRS
jgi:Glycine rich protein